jgi:hypothetical protein
LWLVVAGGIQPGIVLLPAALWHFAGWLSRSTARCAKHYIIPAQFQ